MTHSFVTGLIRTCGLFPALCAGIAISTPESAAGGLTDAPAAVWPRHTVFEGAGCMTAVAADFTKDGVIDIIADTGTGVTRLFVGPDWKPIVLDDNHGGTFIHSETWDIDGDGDADYIGARYEPGYIVWYEQPDQPLTQPWKRRLIDDQVNGIHGVIKGDVDRDGRLDLLATSAQPKPPFPNSLVWISPPDDPRSGAPWKRHVFADQDAPGLSHYLGFGDINGDGRPDAATGAKGGPTDITAKGEYFAWWESPADPTQVWRKHSLPAPQPGATNIHPADLNGDGRTDLLASRGHDKGVIWFQAPDWKEITIDADIQEPHCLQIADVDGDGDLDAATCAYGSELCVWYENDSHGNFKRHVVGEKQQAYDIRILDLDNDGDLDFLVAGRASNNVVWYANPTR